nr:MAG TPA: hypothetical protein [Caudoviricetes sp.]
MRIVVKRIPIEIIELGIETYAQIDIEEILLTSYPPITKTVLKFYPMRRKTPCFSYGDIRRVHRIYASN